MNLPRPLRERAGERLFQLALLVWALAPVVLLFLLTWLPSSANHPLALFTGIVVWSVAAWIVFAFTLSNGCRSESLVSLTCTIFLGLLSFSFSFVNVLGSPFNLAAALSPAGDTATLAAPRRAPSEIRTLYLAAIDLSQSTLRDGAERKKRLDMIDRTMRSIFLEGDLDSPAMSVRADDTLKIYTVSGKIHEPFSNETNEGPGEARRRKVVTELRAQLDDLLAGDEVASRYSDLASFLSAGVCDDIRAARGKFQRVNLILFSSWEQPEDRQDGTIPEWQRTALRRCLGGSEVPTSVLAFCLPAGLVEGQATRCGPTLHALQTQLPETHWQQLNLDDYDRLPAGEQILALESLYVSDDRFSLRIKYCPNSRAESPDSTLTLPPFGPTDHVYMKLRPISGEPSPLRLDGLTSDREPFGLGVAPGEEPKRLEIRQGPLAVRIANHLEAPRDKDFEILVAIPRQSQLYRVRVAIVPALTKSSLWALFALATVMHLFPLPVARRIWLRRRWYRERADAAKGKQRTYTNASPQVL
jgi:hypothetical protein